MTLRPTNSSPANNARGTRSREMGATKPFINDALRKQYEEEGYFILENVIPSEHLGVLRDSCDMLIESMHDEMDRLGTDHIHISHRGKRYHIAKQYDKPPRLAEYVFSPLMAEICRATIGPTAYLFYDQYVAKCAEQGLLGIRTAVTWAFRTNPA